MNQAFVARAPGKLFLLGEYAVLDGGPAIVAAVDRYVEVHLAPRPSRATVRLSTLGHGEPFEVTSERRLPPLGLRFAAAAVDAALLVLPGLAGIGLDVEIRSQLDAVASAAPAPKLGLGASAAVSAAVTAALFAASGRDPEASRDEVFACALAAHRGAQEGVGSGADVAASVYGGIVLFEPRGETRPRVTPLELPTGAEILAAWSGVSASTAPLVRRYLALGGVAAAEAERRGPRHEFVEATRTAVHRFLDDLRAGRLRPDAVDAAALALAKLARHGDLPLLTPALEHIVAVASAAGAGAKLSGAGGGDCAIALAPDATTAARVRAAWSAAGVTVLALRAAARGVTVAEA